NQVRPRYVKEAFRLLRKSIIHVEAEDIVLEESGDEKEEEEEEAAETAEALPTDSAEPGDDT
ncbi:unnamed protein product, partial [Laminaria digitata]